MAEKKDRLPAILKAGEKSKRTLVLTNGVYQRLAAEAERRGVSASDLAEHVLSRALPYFKVVAEAPEDGEAETAA